MKECDHNCGNCEKNRDGTCKGQEASFAAPANSKSKIGKVVAVMSGKGGVGKSLVTQMLAVAARRRGLKTAILDADITGPSIPAAFGILERASGDADGNVLPCRSRTGIEVMSLNLLVEDSKDPVVWRGPVIAGAVKQFWSEVFWGDIDIMFVDMPPGTGDVPLTVFQSLPVSGAVVVSSPQDLVKLIVEKAVRMAGMMNIPVLGLVENMSSFKCPGCGATHRIFGDSKIKQLGGEYGISALAEIPMDAEIAKAVDAGMVEDVDVSAIEGILDALV